MDLDRIQNMYYIGIGGIGMSALANYFNGKGLEVAGYDLVSSEITASLESSNVSITYIDAVDQIPSSFLDKDQTLIVYSVAVPKDNAIFNYFIENGYNIMKRSEVLGQVCNAADTTIAVAGTHGKTTTTSMIAHMLNHAGIDCTAFLGGVMQNGESNLRKGITDSIVVVEADEYDRSFLTINPTVAIITSMDHDHIDVYKDRGELESAFNQFANQTKSGGEIIVKEGVSLDVNTGVHQQCYSVNSSCKINASNIRIQENGYLFDFSGSKEDIANIQLNIGGKHNVENAVAAIAAVQNLNLNKEQITESIATFGGVKRRFEYHIKTANIIYIDDYAHHPEELKAFISSVRDLYPTKKLTGIFQPHLYSRTRDLMDDFVLSLELLDEMILLDIYPARELPIEGITSEAIAEKVNVAEKSVLSKEALIIAMKENEYEVVMTIGAGNIAALVESIKNVLQLKLNK
ncbi:MAG: UDP-N-acetylmuramate--L-alanine ligase [Flavobacteriales bacterium]|nr:UDP-N-acetylmuramate--L-alanine ligase [Flavobacteriales bacterium]